MSFVAGSYDRTLYGFQLSDKNDTTLHLALEFTTISNSCIKSIASSSKYVASGTTDDIISILDLSQDASIITLHFHTGDITCLTFWTEKYLFSGAADGIIIVYRVTDWERIASFKGHKGNIQAIAVHPNGKFFISIGKDQTLRIWDLINSKSINTIKLKNNILNCLWSSNGKKYILISEKLVEVHNTDKVDNEEDSITSFNIPIGYITSCFLNEAILICGFSDGTVRYYDINNGDLLEEFKGNGDRIRGISILPREYIPKSYTVNSEWPMVCTASSNGYISVWDIKENPIAIAEYKAEGRFTCLATSNLRAIKPKVEKKSKEEKLKEEAEIAEAELLKSKKAELNKAKRLSAENNSTNNEKKQELKRKAPKPEKPTSIAHDGVVEFLDTPKVKKVFKKSNGGK